ncbi:MarR family EPS-associated transcriptional regulator [Fidelibacter multiformis]|uniref:MarR family EPS-associated transcriptional regulator n=1 Tax=Fidelibacter multiformis TaxID=3377529 RepID=UPI0037DD703A
MNQDELNLELLRRANGQLTQKSLSQELGYSVGKVNYILKALVDKGLIKIENFATAENKKQYYYWLTPKGMEEKLRLTKKFIVRKKKEYEELQKELRELEQQFGNSSET